MGSGRDAAWLSLEGKPVSASRGLDGRGVGICWGKQGLRPDRVFCSRVMPRCGDPMSLSSWMPSTSVLVSWSLLQGRLLPRSKSD